MTEAQINCFLSVVKEGSFSKAALAQYISQPAISKSISKLEEELGFPLLNRSGSSLQPTTAGRRLAQFWQTKKFEYENILQEIKSTLTEPSGTVNIGCPETWNPVCFLPYIDQIFKDYYPNMDYRIKSDRLPNLMSALQDGKLDMIITHEFHPQIQYGYESIPITSTGCGILYSNKYFTNISKLKSLAEIPILVFDSDIEKQFINQIKKVFDKAGITPKIKSCGLYSTALFEMSCGHGIMVFTDWDIVITNSIFTYLPLDSSLPINIIYSKSNCFPIIKDLGHRLRELFSKEVM